MNYAFIDSQNLNLAIQEQGWKLDWKRFRVYLRDKYKVSKAFLFIGYQTKNENLYGFLKRSGYTLIFKPTLENESGILKGNCDAELVLHCLIELNNFTKAIIVSGDGDFHCLIEYLVQKNKLLKVGIPNKTKYSSLLKKFADFFFFVSDLKPRLEYQKSEHSSRHSHLR